MYVVHRAFQRNLRTVHEILGSWMVISDLDCCFGDSWCSCNSCMLDIVLAYDSSGTVAGSGQKIYWF